MPNSLTLTSMMPQDKKMIIERYARSKERELIEAYIVDGPMALKVVKGFSEQEWDVIFDYLVLEHNLLFKTIIQDPEFFIEEYVKFGMAHLREMFNISQPKYDMVWEQIFDFIVISSDGLWQHVLNHRDRYMLALKARGSDFVRKVLGVWNSKYNESWEKVLDNLLQATCDAIFTENTYERGLDTFCRIMNGTRPHRAIVKHDLSRKF